MPTFETLPRIDRDWKGVTAARQALFRKVVREAFVPDLAVPDQPFQPGLRVKGLAAHSGVFEMKHVLLYMSNGEDRQEFSVLMTARPLGGEPTPSNESKEVHWVSLSDVLGLTMECHSFTRGRMLVRLSAIGRASQAAPVS